MLQRQFALIFWIYTNLAVLVYVSAHIQEFNDARIQTLPAYTVASKADLLNSTCGKELQIFRHAVDQRILWSLKVLDSSGGFKLGFLYGNNYWLGSQSQCLDTMNKVSLLISQQKILNSTLYRNPLEEFPPFKINYFVAHFRHNSTLQYHVHVFNEEVIALGLCLPASCTTSDLSFILENIFRDRINLFNYLYPMDFQLIRVKDVNNDINKSLSNSMLRFICVGLGLSFLMTVIGTVYDIFVHQKRVKKNETNKSDNSMTKEIEMKANMSLHPKNKISEILIGFSAYTNTRKIFSTKLDTDTIPVIYGLKFLSMCWIIISHTVYFQLDSMDNKVWLFKFINSYGIYILDMGFTSADTFFFISGCLLTYTYLRDNAREGLIKPIDCRERLNEFFNYVIKRFIRLTPAYMIVLGILQLSSAWFDKTSQFYMTERFYETCAMYWWRNLLYINNYFGYDAMCMNWSWHLANDMQFYVITMVLLILSTIYFYAAVMVLSALLIVSIILNGYISYIYEYFQTFEEVYRLFDVIYFPSWMRIGPYIIGIIAGYILIKIKNDLVLKEKIIIFCRWFAIISIFTFLILYNIRYMSVLASCIYVALNKILWTISLTWIVIACYIKHGGVIIQLLSFKGWIPFSRLTYCTYLLHPVIILSFRFYGETSIHFEPLPTFVMSVGYIVICYSCSYVLSLIMEMPYITLANIFMKYRNRIHKKVL